MKTEIGKEQIYSGLIIREHEITDAKSKESATNSLTNWQQSSLSAKNWIKALEKGQTIQPSAFAPKADGTFTHAKGYWNSTHFVCCDADNIKGVEFLDDGSDKNPDGIDAWQDEKGLSALYPTLKEKVYAVGQSVSSMSDDKPPKHRRYRLIFLFDERITSEEHYHQILITLSKQFPIIPEVERSPAQPVFGNARDGFNKFAICGNILSLSDYPFEKPKQEPVAGKRNELPFQKSLGEYLSGHNIQHTQRPQGGYYVDCPFKAHHTDGICKSKDAYVFENESGKWAFNCSHASCKSAGRTTWESFKDAHGIPTFTPVKMEKRKKNVVDDIPTDDSIISEYRGLPVVSLHEVIDQTECLVETKLRHEVADEAYDLLKERQSFVVKGDSLGGFRKTRSGISFSLAEKDAVLNELSRAAAFSKVSRRATNLNGNSTPYLKQTFEQNPPRWIAEAILNRTDNSEFPEFKGFIAHPYLYNGELKYRAGFDENTGFYVPENSHFELEKPETSDECLEIIKDLLCDFPFETEADLENALALALTFIVRPSFQGADMPPLFVVTAASPGTGKSELAMVLTTIFLDRVAAVSQISESREEIRKELFSNLMKGDNYTIFDNADPNKTIDCGYLASCASQPKHTGRVLGTNNTLELDNRIITMYTGNNVQATNELVDRGIMIKLESPAKRSKDRDFKRENLTLHVQKNRALYVGALVRMVKHWIEKDMPLSNHRHRMRHWSKTIGGILEANGVGENFLENDKDFRRTADAESPQVARAFSAIYHKFGDKPWTIEDIFTIISYKQSFYHKGNHYEAEGDNLLGEFIDGRDDKGRARAAGAAIKKRVEQTLNGFKLETDGTSRNRNRYKLVQVRTDF